MTGVRLEVRAHLVVGAQSAAQNISKCVQRCGLQVDDLILSSLASSAAVLTRTSASSAWCWSTWAPAPPTSRCSCRARSATPRRCRSPATR
jgi:hypothetical protein